jgi:hypothetical protein
MQVDIPFDFRMGDALMPAGSYQVNYSPRIVTLREQHGGHAALRLLNAVDRRTPAATGVLEFTRYGDSYFFAKIWRPGSTQGGALPKTALEKEFASHAAAPQRTEVAIHNK